MTNFNLGRTFTMERLSYEKILQDLEQFLQLCSSFGLPVGGERFTQYRREIVTLIDTVKTRALSGQDTEQLDRYLIALMEGAEVNLLLPYLQECERTTVAPKIKDCLSGPFTPNDENPNSNRPRNIQFELFLASTLWRSGFEPVLGEHPDLKCRVENRWVFFECKRLFSTSPQKLRERIREAADQIQKNRQKAPHGTRGIIAVSLSRVFNPSQASRPILNEQQGRQELAAWLMNKAHEVRYDANGRDTWEPLSHKKIVGILFYVASVFEDFEANCYSPGRYFRGFSLVNEAGSPDDLAVRKLAQAMEAQEPTKI
jgi:hypothetical protein